MKSVLLSAILLLLSFTASSNELAPKTLLELSHVKAPSIKFDNSILIIIDAQREYSTGQLPLVGLNESVKTIKKLLLLARQKSVPIIHVKHEGGKGGLFDPSGDGFKSLEGLEPLKGELVILKNYPNAFAGTNLKQVIEKFGKGRTLVLTGFMTHMCVTSTASAALDLGFQSAVVKDAVATRDLKGADGKKISAEEVNRSSLAAIQDRLAWVIHSSQL